MANLREHPRVLTLKTARVVADNMTAPIDCAILNLSDGGACILVPRLAQVPDDFHLIVDPEEVTRTCKVRWKSGCRVGLVFVQPDHPDAQSSQPSSAETDLAGAQRLLDPKAN